MLVELLTRRLHLRPLDLADAEAVFAYRSDPAVARYQLWDTRSVEDVRAFIRELSGLEPDTPGTWYQWAITLLDSGELIGDLGLHFPADDRAQAEVGITLAPARQGQGYAREALERVLGYLFDDLHKHRVYARVDPRNAASVRLLERAGLRKEGQLRESVWVRGEWTDDAIYAILEQEWHALAHRPRNLCENGGAQCCDSSAH